MLRIYDETQIRRRFSLKRAQMLMLFVGGAACGLWLAHGGGAVAVADAAGPTGSGPALATRWCDADTAAGLRFDCRLEAVVPAKAEAAQTP